MSIPNSGSSKNLGPSLKTHVHKELDPVEFMEAAQALAAINEKIEHAENEKKKAMRQHNSAISVLESERAELSEVVKTKKKFVQVDAKWAFNTPNPGQKTLMQLDAEGSPTTAIRVEKMGAEDEPLLTEKS